MKSKLMFITLISVFTFSANAELPLDRNLTCVSHYTEPDGDQESDTYEFHFEGRMPMIKWSSTQRSGFEIISVSQVEFKKKSTLFLGKFPWSEVVTYSIEIEENLSKAVIKFYELNGKKRGSDKLNCRFTN